MSDAAVEDILKCLHTLLPPNNLCPKTKAGMQNILRNLQNLPLSYRLYVYCANCSVRIKNCICLKQIASQIAIFDFKIQLQRIIKGNNFLIIQNYIFRIL